jgi:hypothetical protein
VAFAAGNTNGRDHTHWRVSNDMSLRTADLAKLYPVGFTLDEFMLLSWRVKSWKLSGTHSWSDGTRAVTATITDAVLPAKKWDAIVVIPFGGGHIPTQTTSVCTRENEILAYANPAFREWDLTDDGRPPGDFVWQEIVPLEYRMNAFDRLITVFGGAGSFGPDNFLGGGNMPGFTYEVDPTPFTFSCAGDTLNFGPGGVPGYSGCGMGVSMMTRQPQVVVAGQIPQHQVFYDADAQLFYPYFVAGGVDKMTQVTGVGGVVPVPLCIDALFGGGALRIASQISTVNAPGGWWFLDPADVIEIGQISILGHDIPLYLTDASYPVLSVLTADYTLVPNEYWPYQNSLGQPVYDTTTGAQINDPFA